MVRKNVLGCDQPQCARVDARRWKVVTPEGQVVETDLCPDHDGCAHELVGLGHAAKKPMRPTRQTRSLDSRVRMG